MALTRSFWEDLAELDRPYVDLFWPFAFPSWRPRFAFTSELRYMPPTDVFSRKGDIVVRVELPGIDPEKDVHVTLQEGMLDLRGEREQEKEIKEEMISATLDAGLLAKNRGLPNYQLRTRRPELYGEIVREQVSM